MRREDRVLRIVFLVVGTGGDAVPVVSLGSGLAARGHTVVVATSEDHRALVERHGLGWSALSPSYALEAERALAAGRAPDARLLRERMREASGVWPEQGRAATRGAGLLIGSGLMMGAVAASLGEALGIEAVGFGVMPLTATRAFPPPWPPPVAGLPGVGNLMLGRGVRQLAWRSSFAGPAAAFRRGLGLGGRVRHPERVIYGWSPHLLPQPADWPAARFRVTGALGLPEGADFAPPKALMAFLRDGPPPVGVGFGSMVLPDEEGQRLGDAVLAALRRTGRRAVVVRGGGAVRLPPDVDRRLVHVVERVPYRWLLRRVSMFLHHGGAGSVHEAARAGLPQIVVPFVADQPFWAWRLRALGVSPGTMARARLSADGLADLIEAVTPGMQERAAALGRVMAAEDGVSGAIGALEEWGLIGQGSGVTSVGEGEKARGFAPGPR